jgi:hypothetical protein
MSPEATRVMRTAKDEPTRRRNMGPSRILAR